MPPPGPPRRNPVRTARVIGELNHFRPLPQHLKNRINQVRKRNRNNQVHRMRNNTGVNAGHIIDIFKPRRNINANLVDAYLEMVCDYVNIAEGRLVAKRQNEPHLIALNLDFYTRMITAPGVGLGLQMLILNHCGLTADQFLHVQHIFVPITEAGTDHVSLVVISPLSRTVEHFDSGSTRGQDGKHDSTTVLMWIFTLLRARLEQDFVPTEWSTRIGQSPLQRTGSESSEIYVCANALNVALRHPTHPRAYGGTQVENRMWRIAAEIYFRGFTNHREFWYPIVDAPAVQDATQPGVHDVNVSAFVPLSAVGTDTALNRGIKANWPDTLLARTGEYDYYSLEALVAICRADRHHYRGYQTWLQGMNGVYPLRGAAGLRRGMEMRDWRIRRHEYSPGRDRHSRVSYP